MLQNEWEPVREPLSSVSHLASTLSDHLHALLLDDVVLVWVQGRYGFRVIGKRVGDSIANTDQNRGNTGEETSRGECSCNLSMAQIYILFEVCYCFRTEGFLAGPISTRPPHRCNAIYEDPCISYGVEKASKRSEYNSVHSTHP